MKTLIISFSITIAIIGIVVVNAQEQPHNLERYTEDSIKLTALELSTQDKQEVIALEQLDYEQKHEPQSKETNTLSFNEHELRIYNECKALDMTLEQTAFVLANTRHETAQYKHFQEIDGRNQAIKLGYKGGADWYGRGYIQLTHNTNYALWSKWTGVDLVSNPDILITDLDLSAFIACSGVKFGSFTASPPISHYVNDHNKDYYNAREIVNGDKLKVGNLIAGYTQEYINKLNT